MARGGARPGAGRPKGSNAPRGKNKLTAEIMVVNKARAKAGEVLQVTCTPLEAMLDNMMWARDKAAAELQEIFEKAKKEGDAKTQLGAFTMLSQMRDRLQDYAEGAARYVHAIPKPPEAPPEPLPEHLMKEINPFHDLLEDISRRFAGIGD
jgi:hypothetical protein